jgi:hypothetical protein
LEFLTGESSTNAIVSAIFNVLIYLAIIPGMWVAMRSQPVVTGWLRRTHYSAALANPFVRFILWLALGYFFTLPLIDLLYWIENWIGLASTLGQGSLANSLLSNYFITIVLYLVVYGVVLWGLRSFWVRTGWPKMVARLLAAGGVASMITGILRNTQIPFSFLQVNLGGMGFFIGWAVALLVIIFVISLINLERQQSEKQ